MLDVNEKTRSAFPTRVRSSLLSWSNLEKNPETDWDDTPEVPRFVIPVRFRVFPTLFGQKTLKQIGMTRLGSPGVSSQSVSVFSWPFSAKNLETDWDWNDKPGKPRLVIPVCISVFWPKRAKKT